MISEPAKGIDVSFVLETSEKDDNAIKIYKDNKILKIIFSDIRRKFNIIVK